MAKCKKTRRQFLAKTSAAAGAAAGSSLIGCSSEAEPQGGVPEARRTSDDPHAAVQLPGRGEIYRPSGNRPALRTT